MPLFLGIVYIGNFDQNAGFVNIAKFIVNGCSEVAHGAAQVHVGIYERRNIFAKVADMLIQNAVPVFVILTC